MSLLDYLFYVGNLNYSIRKGGKNVTEREEEDDEGEECNYLPCIHKFILTFDLQIYKT